ncbi:hypothetical protein GCM10010340_02570 [Streptomyces griseoloalbus]|nr:hypothetical protein GCM10010294_07940 [Streptomyces griseoloalbus]GGW28493.1 hypothetical protein GCM10010340_02570 [Streptomyces albaduncus]
MAHPGRRACLAPHPQSEVGQFGAGGIGVGAQFLDRHLAAQDFVQRLPHHAHSAAPELRGDPVAAGQQATGSLRLSVLPR